MTADTYNYLAPRFNRYDTLIDAIPQNVNRAGKTYKRLVKQICTDSFNEGIHERSIIKK